MKPTLKYFIFSNKISKQIQPLAVIVKFLCFYPPGGKKKKNTYLHLPTVFPGKFLDWQI